MKRSPVPRKSGPDSSPLWILWEKTARRNPRRVVLVEAEKGTSWTAAALNEEVLKLLDTIPALGKGSKVAFCLPNGAEWMALFLALQKRGLAAMPLDAGLPEQACVEMAQQLRCRALYLHGKFHVFDSTAKSTKRYSCVKVTSGTSGGLPKKVPCLAEHLIADGKNIIRTMGIRPNDRNLAVIPLGHSYGLGNFVMPLILQGTALVCAKQFVPRQIIDWMAQYRVTVFPSVPAIFRVLASMSGEIKLAPLRLAISAGAPLTAEVARAFFERYHLKLHNFYGSSETGGICYDRRGDATLNGRSVGKPLSGVTVTIHRDIIRVESGAVAKPNHRWKMPDHGAWNDKGELTLTGRSGREINIGGKKVHPSEIEHALRAIPGIADAIVLTDPNPERVLIRAAVETSLSLVEVQRALTLRLPDWKHPKDYLLMPKLPRTSRGKIDVLAFKKL